jgi:hypothetical protein
MVICCRGAAHNSHMHLELEKSKPILMVLPSPPHQGIIPSFLGQMAAMGLGMSIKVPAAIDTYLVSQHQCSYYIPELSDSLPHESVTRSRRASDLLAVFELKLTRSSRAMLGIAGRAEMQNFMCIAFDSYSRSRLRLRV